MDRFTFLFVTVAMVVCTTTAAPWVVLDSRSDMLALSSEVTDGEVAFIVPPEEFRKESESIEYDSPEEVQEVENAPTTTTTEETVSPVTETTTTQESVQTEESTAVPLASITDENLEENTKPTTDTTEPQTDDKDVSESTTTAATVGAKVESDLKHEDLHIQVITEPTTYPDDHANSIEDDISIEPIIIITMRRHPIFNRKQTYGI